jgi:hypothetical protein
MSNALAIASVTAVLKDLLDNAIIDHSLNTAVGDRIEVTSMPPDRIRTGSPEKAQLNVFLYNVVPNQGWRNVGLPSHGGQGERLTNPPLALDLYYLLSAYVKQDFDAEILLGYAMQTLHEMPVLTRDAIRKALRSPSPVTGDDLPSAVGDLSASDLAEQVELIKITPHQVNSEEISKLWSAFQANYRPSVAYHVSVVLIESRHSTRSALPVRERSIYSYPVNQPVIEQVRAEEGINQPIVSGGTLVIHGRQLLADVTKIRIGDIKITPAPENVSDTKISLLLPPELKAGVQGLQVVHEISMGTSPKYLTGAESSAAAFILRPTITPSVSNVTSTISNGNTLYSADITVSFNPIVGNTQRVILLLNEFNPPDDQLARSYSFHAPIRDQDVNSIVIQITGIEGGDYLVRVQVDGAQSPLIVDTDPVSPTFRQYVNPKVTIT